MATLRLDEAKAFTDKAQSFLLYEGKALQPFYRGTVWGIIFYISSVYGPIDVLQRSVLRSRSLSSFPSYLSPGLREKLLTYLEVDHVVIGFFSRDEYLFSSLTLNISCTHVGITYKDSTGAMVPIQHAISILQKAKNDPANVDVAHMQTLIQLDVKFAAQVVYANIICFMQMSPLEAVKALAFMSMPALLTFSNVFKGIKTTDKAIRAAVNGIEMLLEFISRGHRSVRNVCETCGKEASKRCGSCCLLFYCTRECQKADWTRADGHKFKCPGNGGCISTALMKYSGIP